MYVVIKNRTNVKQLDAKHMQPEKINAIIRKRKILGKNAWPIRSHGST